MLTWYVANFIYCILADDVNFSRNMSYKFKSVVSFLKILVTLVLSKIQLTIIINFISSNNTAKERVMHSKSDNIEFMICENTEKVIEKLFKSLLNRYKIGLETSMRGSYFIFDCVHFLYYKHHKINPNPGRSYIDSPNRI